VSVSASVSIAPFGIGMSASVSKSIPGEVKTQSRDNYDSTDTTHSTSHTSSQTQQSSLSHEKSTGTNRASYKNTQANQGQELAISSHASRNASKEIRTAASFSLGFRSRFTPFPDLPTGSLLLVEVQQGRLHDIHVIRSNTTVLAKEDTDLYFVVNDCRPESQVPQKSDDQLAVHYVVQSTLNDRVSTLISQMGQAIEDLNHQQVTYLQQGAITSHQMEDLKRQAEGYLVQAGQDTDEFKLVKELYQGWISTVLEQLELKVRILQMERKMSPALRHLLELEQSLKWEDHNLKISKLSQIWSSEQFDLERMGHALSYVTRELRERVLPVMKVRYPQMLAELGTELGAEQGRFRDTFQITSPLTQLSQQMQVLLERLSAKIKQTCLNVKHQTIALRFPKVYQGEVSYCNRLDATSCPYVSPLVAQEVWTAIRNAAIPLDQITLKEDREKNRRDSIATLKVQPQDLYVKEGVWDPVESKYSRMPINAGALSSCSVAPIVEGMGLYLNVDELEGDKTEKLNHLQISKKVKIVGDLLFTQSHSPTGERFQVTVAWGGLDMPIFFGNQANPIGDFTRLNILQNQVGQGISPFTQFQIDFRQFNFDQGTLAKIFPNLSEVVLVFHVHYQNSACAAQWLNHLEVVQYESN